MYDLGFPDLQEDLSVELRVQDLQHLKFRA